MLYIAYRSSPPTAAQWTYDWPIPLKGSSAAVVLDSAPPLTSGCSRLTGRDRASKLPAGDGQSCHHRTSGSRVRTHQQIQPLSIVSLPILIGLHFRLRLNIQLRPVRHVSVVPLLSCNDNHSPLRQAQQQIPLRTLDKARDLEPADAAITLFIPPSL